MNELIDALNAPFAVGEHEFHRGYVYLSEEAISRRLDTVAAGWTWELFQPDVRVTDAGVYIAQRGRLTIAGVFRDGVGMAAPVLNKNKDSEVNEPEKSAATDAFKRAARMFGIGRYLLSTPEWVKDHEALKKWLGGASQQRQAPQAAPQAAPQQRPAPQPSAPAPQHPNPQPGDVARGDQLEAWLNEHPSDAQRLYSAAKGVLMTVALRLLYGNNTHHMKASLEKHEKEGLLKPDMTVAAALIALAQRKASAA